MLRSIYNRLYCWYRAEHDDRIEMYFASHRHFVELAQCRRCGRQWWMKGEKGEMRGVRFVQTKMEYPY